MINRVVASDCREYLKSCWIKGFDFIFADPPFNLGRSYDVYCDRQLPEVYLEFTRQWIEACWLKLNPGAAMAIHCSWQLSFDIIGALSDLRLKNHIEQEIIWAFNFGQCTFSEFINGHCKALILRKPPECYRKFYPENVLVPSKRLRIGDKRVESSPYKGMILPSTVWGFATDIEPWEPESYWGRVQGNNGERRELHDNQLPELYVGRMIAAYTKQGDLVFDPFGGSGTTAVVAAALKRNFVTTEISTAYCQSIQRRLQKGSVRYGV